jgi:hypothetical protein
MNTMTIESIFLRGQISVRSYHSCRSSEIDTIEELIKYYEKFNSFLKLRMCGEKSNLELIKICQIYSDCFQNTENGVAEEKLDDLKDKILKLNRLQRQIVNHHISIQISKLSVRSRNALIFFLEKEINIINLFDKIFSKTHFKFNSIENVGLASIGELELFTNEIKLFVIDISELTEEKKMTELQLKLFLQKEFNNLEIPSDLISRSSIFSLIQFIISKHLVFGKNESYILENAINIYNNSVLQNLDELSENIHLTRERCRQIRVKILDELESKFLFLTKFDQNLFVGYKIDFNDPFIIITDEIALNINSSDETNFSKHFITLISSFFYNNEFELLGNQDDVFIAKDFKARARHNWKNLYLVSKILNTNFDFVKFIEDIEIRNLEFIDETYQFNFKSYLSNFLKLDDFNLLEILADVCEKLLNEEFNIYLNIEENIVFERKTFKTLPEYAFEALEVLGKPSHIDEINNQIKILKPDYINVIKNTTLKREFGFVPFGRASIFGLKKWDTEKANIKGGTIRSIAEEFLSKYSEPMNIKDIAKFVLKYRPKSNEKSIIYNLKMEDNNRFVFFKNAFIGLKSKKYNLDKYLLLKDNEKITTRTWEENLQELLNFISNNNKLPSSINCPLEEVRISRWLYTQKSKINRGLLDNSQTELIIGITSKFNLRDNKKTLFRTDGYRRLNEFIEKEKRLPSANKNQESQLYAFFYKQRKLYEDSKLDIEDELNFLEVAKLIQNF